MSWNVIDKYEKQHCMRIVHLPAIHITRQQEQASSVATCQQISYHKSARLPSLGDTSYYLLSFWLLTLAQTSRADKATVFG